MAHVTNLYYDLINLLQEKESAERDQVYSIKERIKVVASQLDSQDDLCSNVDAAFAFYLAGYYVRAMQLVNIDRVEPAFHPAQYWLALIVAKQFDSIIRLANNVIENVKYSDSQICVDVKQNGLTDSEAVDRILLLSSARALISFVNYISSGELDQLETTQTAFRKLQVLARKSRGFQWWWWIECIRLVIEEFVQNSLWTQLDPMRNEIGSQDLVTKYIKANYSRKQKVVELWRTQVEALPSINDPERKSFCVSIPTSGGKTRIAELAVLRFLLDYPDSSDAKCVYIAPFRKLANEVEQSLSDAFCLIGRGLVSSFYGWNEIDPLDQMTIRSARVLIVTPEKLDGMLRSEPDLVNHIKLVIADEGHLIGADEDRGYKYKMLLERLIYCLRIKNRPSGNDDKPRLLLVSGVLPNAEEMSEFITGKRSNKVQVNWRPREDPIKDIWLWKGNLKFRSHYNYIDPSTPFQTPGWLQENITFEEIVARVAFSNALGAKTMVFSASKRAIMSEKLLNTLLCMVDHQRLIETDNVLLPDHNRQKSFEKYFLLLKQGIGIHHAGLPAQLRHETEKLIDENKIRLLFASPTLAQGVNIPFDRVLIFKLQHYMGKPIQNTTFWNAIGRVGRPVSAYQGESSLGSPQVVFIVNQSDEASKEDKLDLEICLSLLQSENQYRIASPFLEFLKELRVYWINKNKSHNTSLTNAELVNQLAEMPDLNLEWVNKTERKGLSHALRMLDDHLVALLEDPRAANRLDEWLQTDITDVINLLVGASTIGAGDLKFIEQFVLARATFIARKIPVKQRHQDYLLGLPQEDCDVIRSNENILLQWFVGCQDIFSRQMDTGVENLVLLMDFVAGLSIISKQWRKPQISTLPMFGDTLLDENTVNRRLLFHSWIFGEPIDAIRNIWRKIKPRVDFNDYREEILEKNLVWGVSAICRYLSNKSLDDGLTLTKDLDYLPTLVKYGVSGKLACFLVKLKIPRDTAVKIADLYVSRLITPLEDDDTYPEVEDAYLLQAKLAIISLSEKDLDKLEPDEITRQQISLIRSNA